MIIWLTGISGAGKTTLSKNLLKVLNNSKYRFVSLDGDEIRELFGKDLGYSLPDRIKQIKRIQNLCKFLDNQKIDVIASALYFSEEISSWNRKNFSSYYEIYIKTSLEMVSTADVKGIYERYNAGKEKNVVGVDIKWIEPQEPFLVLDRDMGIKKKQMVQKILDNIPDFIGMQINEKN